MTEKNVEDALIKLASLGLVRVYEVDQKPFLVLPTWEKHQTIRAKSQNTLHRLQKHDNPQASEIICKQMQTNASKCSRNPIQSNPIQSESNPNPYCTESDDSQCRNEEIIESIPGPEMIPPCLGLTSHVYQEWVKLYPSVGRKTSNCASMVGLVQCQS